MRPIVASPLLVLWVEAGAGGPAGHEPATYCRRTLCRIDTNHNLELYFQVFCQVVILSRFVDRLGLAFVMGKYNIKDVVKNEFYKRCGLIPLC